MKKILLVFGTRPEAIKIAPLIKQLKKYNKHFETKVCVTGQHRQMLDQVLDFFDIKPDYDLDLMMPRQTLYSLTSDVINGIKDVLQECQPEYVFVHGDTTTSFAAALSSFYFGAKICHVEAGLRTYNKFSPFPEEINRQLTGKLADIHFAPTDEARNNLTSEGVSKQNIIVTGNTVIDALFWAVNKLNEYSDESIEYLKTILHEDKKIILVTGHRRENFGSGMLNICSALKDLSVRNDVQIIYPVHLNPNVQGPVYEILNGCKNVHLISPLSYPSFLWLMKSSHLILTDSGGIQEEAPSLGKPVLVMRDTTERPEAVAAGTVLLVGADREKILQECNRLLDDNEAYDKMSLLHNPYGDGRACERIVDFLKRF